MQQNCTEGIPVVYLDETWCITHVVKTKTQVEQDITCHGGTSGDQQS